MHWVRLCLQLKKLPLPFASWRQDNSHCFPLQAFRLYVLYRTQWVSHCAVHVFDLLTCKQVIDLSRSCGALLPRSTMCPLARRGGIRPTFLSFLGGGHLGLLIGASLTTWSEVLLCSLYFPWRSKEQALVIKTNPERSLLGSRGNISTWAQKSTYAVACLGHAWVCCM